MIAALLYYAAVDSVYLGFLTLVRRDFACIALALHCCGLVVVTQPQPNIWVLGYFKPIHILTKLLWYMCLAAVIHSSGTWQIMVMHATGVFLLGAATYIIPAMDAYYNRSCSSDITPLPV
jgi:hypothetical protein